MSQTNPQKPPAQNPNHRAQVQGGAEGEEEEEELEPAQQRFLLFNVMPSWMVSFITHIALIIILALLVLPRKEDRSVSLNASDNPSAALEEDSIDLDTFEFEETDALETEIEESAPEEVVEEEPQTVDVPVQTDLPAEQISAELNDSDLTGAISDSNNETNGRTDGNAKSALLKKHGGSKASEAAVQLGLKWIADHQLPNGGWSFDHRVGPGKHRTSPNPGSAVEATNGATAIAILPFLGAGNTHLNGKYKTNVKKGLEFLMRNARRSGRGISYMDRGGSMYSHGLAAIVFGEAYAMTNDSELQPFAQGTINFIEDAQDPVGGGWRYAPQQAGDTSAVGWQVMALKSGKLSGFKIRPQTYKLTSKFLDSVSIDSGAIYGYTGPPRDRSARNRGRTAIGLLCRMYMGWQRDSPGLADGVEYLADNGPDVNPNGANMYYNYYGTQVMKHYGGGEWKKWNAKMRDFLVETQSKDGVATGSWMFGQRGHDTEKGGRLYVTALSTMTLEVYYRYLPLYSDKAADDEWILD